MAKSLAQYMNEVDYDANIVLILNFLKPVSEFSEIYPNPNMHSFKPITICLIYKLIFLQSQVFDFSSVCFLEAVREKIHLPTL